jgi:subfamily B ATP-binding cassette protein MsbA
VNTISRVLSFVWPHRRRLLTSVLFAGLVAMLWSVTLLLAFPVMKVLLQGEHLDDYVQREIVAAELDLRENTPVNLPISPTWKLNAFRLVQTHIVPLAPKDQFDTLAAILVLLLVCTVLKGTFRFIQEVLIAGVVEASMMGLREEAFRRTLSLDYQTLSLDGTSQLMSRFTFDMQQIKDGLMVIGVRLVREPLKAIACLVCAFLVNWQLTLLSLLFVPLTGLVFYRLGRKLKRASHRMMESMSRIYKVLEESFDSVKVLIAFGGQRRHRDRFHAENKEYYAKVMTIAKIDAISNPAMEMLGMLAILLGVLPGAYLVLRETRFIWGIQLSQSVMEIAELAVMYTLLAGIVDPARKLSNVFTVARRALVAADRVFELIDRETLVEENPQARTLPRHHKSIEFTDVNFRYAVRDETAVARPAALQDVTLRVGAGEVVAVVGENGSGKSTLLNLLPRFYDAEAGSVRIDGTDIREVGLKELRSQIGVVTQDPMLFDDTIAENIRYGKSDATREEIEDAARKTDALSFIEQLPDGFETRVGEKGQSLSGGQRQRVTLARAIVRDPAILILDEPTSAIDAQSEYALHKVLRSFVQGRTTFIVTHSVSPTLLDLITQVAVMDQGKLVAFGPHETLIDTCPLYQQLFNSQVRQRSA